jgi:hypothetical protein
MMALLWKRSRDEVRGAKGEVGGLVFLVGVDWLVGATRERHAHAHVKARRGSLKTDFIHTSIHPPTNLSESSSQLTNNHSSKKRKSKASVISCQSVIVRVQND